MARDRNQDGGETGRTRRVQIMLLVQHRLRRHKKGMRMCERTLTVDCDLDHFLVVNNNKRSAAAAAHIH